MKWMRIGGTAAVAAALAIVLALSLGLWSHWTASAQDTFIVNDDTTPADGGCGTPDFQTEDIEEAIDDTDVADGDTLLICEGTYTGGVTIDKEVVVEGRAAANRDEIVIQVPDAGADGLTISTTSVTVRHLKLDGPVDHGGGILVQSSPVTISDVEVTKWATGTPTPTATPGATRTIDLSPPGWHDLAWSGADATDPSTALACIAGEYSIAYAWEGPTAGFKRHVEGCAIPGICNMAALNKYDALLVNISAADASCEMPVAP